MAAVRTVEPSLRSYHQSSSHSSRSGPARTAQDVIDRINAAETRSLRPRSHAGSLVPAQKDPRTIEDINAEIAALEAEARARNYERKAHEERDMALSIHERSRSVGYEEIIEEKRVYRRPREEIVLFERNRSLPPRDEYVVYERRKPPPRNVVRVEKDRKGRMALVRSSR
ncbi:hypothetical protein AC578_8899 [Pseudocercospora eumusae]|uniref:Uncharacterized protein n=1 Tax=Pseudocercospora eumusae TaxID=321146 RepID=A0A139HBU4_9PEZI|nr:hypothetical protein AC578_8899 [Pseudocercospora eumusae]